MPALFEFRGVEVVDGDQTILRGIDLDVADEGITVVTGPSGCGKSTLLRLCNRLEVPTAGTLRFRGRSVMSIDAVELRREVGMVFQRPTPFPGTVAENLRAAAELDDGEVAALLAQVGLPEELGQRDALTLSGGEAQRMCLARTLATGCSVVLADECTSSLDPDATAVVESAVRRLADTVGPVVWVTHDPAQADRLADHRVRMEEGRVVD